jgi:hypothetical protein
MAITTLRQARSGVRAAQNYNLSILLCIPFLTDSVKHNTLII